MHFLLSFVYYRLNQESKFYIHLREALFLKPEVIDGYTRFLPESIFADLWLQIKNEDEKDIVKFRYFALALEINGLFPSKREMKPDEFRKLESDFLKMYREFKEHANLRAAMQPRILHYLCWLVYYSQKLKNFDKLEDYRTIMLQIDPETWSRLQEKNLGKDS